MKPLLVVASEGREFRGILPHADQVTRLGLPVDYSRGVRMGQDDWLLVANGAGPRMARRAAESAAHLEPRAVLSTGFCGALDPALPLYGIVAADTVEDGAQSWHCSQPVTRKPFVSGTIVSLDHVVGTAQEKVCLRTGSQTAVEMEAAALGQWTAQCGIPFYCVRVVTDCAGEGFAFDFNRLRDRDGRFSRTRILAEAARNPVKMVPELIRLEKRGRVAAGMLGDFLVDCRF